MKMRTRASLHDEMKKIGGKLLVKTINELCSGTLKEINQTDIQQLKPGGLHPAHQNFHGDMQNRLVQIC